MDADQIDRDTDTLARTIYGEARGEFITGMNAVASVIGNRCNAAQEYIDKHGKNHPLFGDGSPASACKMPWQFSCWNHNDPNCAIIQSVDIKNGTFSQCLKIAQDAIAGNLEDETLGATYYYDRRSQVPKWAMGKSPCVTIGHHLFFNNID